MKKEPTKTQHSFCFFVKVKKWLCLVFLTSLNLTAQEMVKGVIYDGTNPDKPTVLMGANVYWEGTSEGTISDENGYFELLYRKSKNNQLIISYVGFKTDTLKIEKPVEILHWMIEENSLDEVVLKKRKQTSFRSLLTAQNITHVSSAELLKAACCNLSESFETNPAIDVNFPDAVTGTRQIKMLGLTSPYTLITLENIPAIRGAAQSYGLSFIPGTWVESIQIAKGAGSVINGYESIAGHINAELRKPATDDKIFVNAYVASDQRYELNNHLNFKLNDRWHTGLYLHGNIRPHAMDENDDGFMDMPRGHQVNVLNRWQYTHNEKGWIGFVYLHFITDDKEIGQTHITQSGHGDGHGHAFDDGWGGKIETLRAEVSAKIGYVFPSRPYESVGWQSAYSYHRQNSHFGVSVYNINHQSFYSNFIFNSIISDTRHQFKTGFNATYDRYDEELLFDNYRRNEFSGGAFFEYAFNNLNNVLVTAGIRADYHNRIGFFATPRLHAQYTLWDNTVLKASIGRGVRTPSVFVENQTLFASSRRIVVENSNGEFYGLDAEDAWNYGLSLTQNFKLAQRSGNISLDFYRTDFVNQIVVDLENPREARIYNLEGKSFANNFQTEINFSPWNRTDLRLSYRYIDVKTDYKSGLLEKPLTPKHRFFVNAAYQTALSERHSQWRFDATYNWLSKQRFPDTSANLLEYRRSEYTPVLHTLNAQITRVFTPRLEVYVGGENITGERQRNPVIAADDPYGMYFDTTLVYGPIFGSMYYAGIRWKL